MPRFITADMIVRSVLSDPYATLRSLANEYARRPGLVFSDYAQSLRHALLEVAELFHRNAERRHSRRTAQLTAEGREERIDLGHRMLEERYAIDLVYEGQGLPTANLRIVWKQNEDARRLGQLEETMLAYGPMVNIEVAVLLHGTAARVPILLQ